MIAVVQRVESASVDVVAADGSRERAGAIERGACVLLGVVHGDGEAEAAWMARKLVALRIHADEDDRMNRSLADVGGAGWLTQRRVCIDEVVGRERIGVGSVSVGPSLDSVAMRSHHAGDAG